MRKSISSNEYIIFTIGRFLSTASVGRSDVWHRRFSCQCTVGNTVSASGLYGIYVINAGLKRSEITEFFIALLALNV
jgi:hypothetical protein